LILMSGKADVRTLVLLCFVPLFGAIHANNISFLVLLDLCVWLVAVVSFYYVIKAPIELYLLVKAANINRNNNSHSSSSRISRDYSGSLGSISSNNDSSLTLLENRLLYTCAGTLPLALGGWLALEEVCSRYKLHAMSETIHPYFLIVVVIGASVGPILDYYRGLKKRFVTQSVGPEHDIKELYRLLHSREDTITALSQRLDDHTQVTDHHIKRIVAEIKNLKKATRCECDRGAVSDLDSRLISLENQVELVELMMKEKVDISRNRSILEMLVPNPLRMFSSKGLDSSIFNDDDTLPHSGGATR